MKSKRILSIFLALVLVLTMLPMPVQAAKGDKLIALTFDDGPHKTYTKQLLNGLRERDVNVTFFMVGSNAAANIGLVQQAYDDGHEIGNHTYSHPNLNTLGASGVKSQLNSTSAVLDRVCGSGTDYLVRPPYGNANATVLSAMNAPAIIWSVDTNDWQYRNANHVYSHIVNNAYDGAIILCHDIYSTTVSGALQAVDTLKARGYEFVTVSELYRRRGQTLQDGVKYYNLKNNGTDAGPVEKPVITYEPADGAVRVTISSPSGAPVYYTLSGGSINQQSTKYTGSFAVSCPAEIRAVAAFDLNGDKSDMVVCNLNMLPCLTPEIKIKDGAAVITCATAGAPVYYTTDGTAPTTASAPYTGAIPVTNGMTIRAIAGGGNYMLSGEAVRHYSVNGNVFSDVFPQDWYYSSIDNLATTGFMKGVGNDAFEPNTSTTRAMLVTMLYRYSGESLEKGWKRTNTFKDTENGMWYSEAIEWAYRNDVVDGYGDGTFCPDKSITREEMAKVFAGFIHHRGYRLDSSVDCRDKFKDGKLIQPWALESVNAIVKVGLIIGEGDGRFNPAKSATRAEVATVLVRYIDIEKTLEKLPEPTPEPTPTPSPAVTPEVTPTPVITPEPTPEATPTPVITPQTAPEAV